jgi:hypothetical protein
MKQKLTVVVLNASNYLDAIPAFHTRAFKAINVNEAERLAMFLEENGQSVTLITREEYKAQCKAEW